MYYKESVTDLSQEFLQLKIKKDVAISGREAASCCYIHTLDNCSKMNSLN